ncbi:MAG: hypothetical protein ABWW66_07080 [Archaeoglobaceae archaeon]
MRLRTKLLKEEDRYRGIVRLGKDLRFRPKNYIAITGKRKTAARVWIERSREFVWIDEITAKNAKVSIGDTVKIEKIEPRQAKLIVLSGEDPSNVFWPPSLASKLLKETLVGRVATGGDLLALKTPLGLAVYEVIETNPDGFVVVAEDTDLEFF